MNILFVASEYYGRCDTFMLDALRRNATRVQFVRTGSTLPSPARLLRHVRRKLSIQMLGRDPWIATWRRALNRRLASWPHLDEYDLILFSENGHIQPETFSSIRKRTPAILAAWLGDSCVQGSSALGPYYAAYPRNVDILFFPDVQWCREAGDHARFLPYGADPNVHRPLNLEPHERKALACDIALVGVMTPERLESLRILSRAGFDVGVWGACTYRWTRHLSRHFPPDIRPLVRGGIVTPKMVNLINNASRLVLNIHAAQFSPEGINNRTFEVGATATFQLLNFTPHLPSHDQGIHRLVFYSQPHDLVDRATYYLKHDRERQEIGQAFAEDVKRHHTYDHRVIDLLNMATSARRRSRSA